MNVTRCNRSVETTNGACYYMSFITDKYIYGVTCTLVRRKLCPYHPKYKEYLHVDTNERLLAKLNPSR